MLRMLRRAEKEVPRVVSWLLTQGSSVLTQAQQLGQLAKCKTGTLAFIFLLCMLLSLSPQKLPFVPPVTPQPVIPQH